MSFHEGIGCDQTTIDDVGRRNATRNILQELSASGLKNACQAAVKAGLDGLLSGPELHTLFAPRDEAFASLSPNSIQNEDEMASLMRRHILPGAIRSVDLKGSGDLNPAASPRLRIEREGGEIRANGARISSPDIICTNGVVHVIDSLFTEAKSGGAA